MAKEPPVETISDDLIESVVGSRCAQEWKPQAEAPTGLGSQSEAKSQREAREAGAEVKSKPPALARSKTEQPLLWRGLRVAAREAAGSAAYGSPGRWGGAAQRREEKTCAASGKQRIPNPVTEERRGLLRVRRAEEGAPSR